jgi:2-keto-myo-inositol isomerase
MRSSQLAINSISTRQSGLEEAVKAYADAGFKHVEFHLPLVKEWLADGHTHQDLRQLLADHSVTCIGGFELPVECFTSVESRSKNQHQQLENAQLLDALGGGTLIVGTDGPTDITMDALDVVADTIANMAKRFEGSDVTIGLEFNWSPVIKSLQSAAIVCEKVNHPQVGILFDSAHYYTTVTKFEHLNSETIGWIKHVHVNDMRPKPGDFSDCNADRVLPGRGILDLPAMFGVLEQHGYDGFFSIELFNEEIWQLPVQEAARQCYASLAQLCG